MPLHPTALPDADSISPRPPLLDSLPITYLPLRELQDNLLHYLEALRDAHGPIAAVQDGSKRIVFVFGPEYVHEVLSDTSKFQAHFVPVRGPRNSAQRRLSSGLLSMNGGEHRLHRRMLQGPFQKQSVLSYHERIVTLVRTMIETWKVGELRDLKEEMTAFMLRVTAEILFGFEHEELALEIGHLLDRWMELNQTCGTSAVATEFDDPQAYEELLQSAEEVESKIREMIAWQVNSRRDGHDILSILSRTEADGGHLTENQLIGHAAMLFGAAHLTTARTLTWTLFLLAQHPEIMSQLGDELSQSIGERAPERDDLERLAVLGSVVKESMRILPASAHSHRVTSEPTRLGPFSLPTGTAIVFSPFATQRNPELYPEPRRFTPQRWNSIHPSPYEYFPFAAGPRMCLGGPLALMIVKITVPMILAKFGLRVEPGQSINLRVAHTMLSPNEPVLVRLLPPGQVSEFVPMSGNVGNVVHFEDIGA